MRVGGNGIERASATMQVAGPSYRILFRFFILGLQSMVATLGLIKEKSWKGLGVFLGALALFATVPRLIICRRCRGYGKNCYSLHRGKLTSKYLPKFEEKDVGLFATVLEATTLTLIANAPSVGMRKNRKLPALYIFLATLTLVLQFSHACRHCALYATDWKRTAPRPRLTACS